MDKPRPSRGAAVVHFSQNDLNWQLWPLLLTWINFDPSISNYIHHVCDEITYMHYQVVDQKSSDNDNRNSMILKDKYN